MRFFGGAIKLFDRVEISGRSGGGDPYLTRWRIIDSKWFGIFLHKMHRPDASPILHDHPWPFVSFVLRGGYTERRKDMDAGDDGPARSRHVGHINLKRLKDAHYIRSLDRTPTWTLVFVGRTHRVWGYWEQVRATQVIMAGTGDIIGPGTWYRTCWHHHANHRPVSRGET